MEKMQKNVVTLSCGQTLEQVDAYYLSGMRVALLEDHCPAEELDRLCQLVKTTFYAHNDPIGLMLRLTQASTQLPLAGYQYILLDGDAAETFRSLHEDFTGLLLVTGENGWAFADGVVTDVPAVAAKARDMGLLVLSSNPGIRADGLLWAADSDPAKIAAREEDLSWDADYLYAQLQKADADKLYGPMAALTAMKCGAKAILILTTEGDNLSQLSRLYPPIPLITIAKRPEREAMLLCQTMRWNTLPTAITRTPESMDVEGFARFVAELYGYEKGDRFVALGHWVPGQNQQNLCCFTL